MAAAKEASYFVFHSLRRYEPDQVYGSGSMSRLSRLRDTPGKIIHLSVFYYSTDGGKMQGVFQWRWNAIGAGAEKR